MTRKLRDDCFLHDDDRLRHGEALAILRERIAPVAAVVELAPEDAAGRILAEPVVAPRPIPAHTNAAVDGYAFAHADYDAGAGSTLPVSGRAAAGHALAGPAEAGTALRIFTGAAMPEGTDSVVMQEDVESTERDGVPLVRIPPGLKPGANCRLAGEDSEAGATLLEAGGRLRPQDVAAAASTGLARIRCYAPLRVAVFSTGDEVVRAGEPLEAGQVYDANAPMLHGLIAATGAECVDLGVLPDDAATVEQRLAEAAGRYDALITSGGASRGDEDHVVNAVDTLGALHMWQIAVKPGRPMAFGQIGDCVFLGLPGNPVAVFVCFLLYVRPVLVRLSGGHWPEPARFPVQAAFSVPKKKTGRREFWRAFLTRDTDGRLAVEKFARDGSGLISGLCAADGLVEVPEDATEVREGQQVAFIPFTEFGIGRG
ncbi:MAG: molybdopterin molybdotransferase MoeA [Hyphomicrobiales bacterium]|nr:molybdopterin molybdotransferase MoeA [Hyphomicrobiales bacterium]